MSNIYELNQLTLVSLSSSMMRGGEMIQEVLTGLIVSNIIQNFQSVLDHTTTAKSKQKKRGTENALLMVPDSSALQTSVSNDSEDIPRSQNLQFHHSLNSTMGAPRSPLAQVHRLETERQS